jgi:hypothetical protein
MGEDDYTDEFFSPTAGLGTFSLAGGGTTFNTGGLLGDVAGMASYNLGTLAGEDPDTAGGAAASYSNSVSDIAQSLPGQTNNSNAVPSSTTPVPSTANLQSWFGRGVTAILGIVFVVAALYLFGSSNLSDAISSVADHASSIAAKAPVE